MSSKRTLGVVLLAFAVLGTLSLASCKPACVMSGTITYLNGFGVDISGETYTIFIDVDTDFTNGNEVAVYTGTWESGTNQDYAVDIGTVEPGDYYLAVLVEPAGWYIYGYYGGTLGNQGHSPRVLAPVDCGARFDIIIEAT